MLVTHRHITLVHARVGEKGFGDCVRQLGTGVGQKYVFGVVFVVFFKYAEFEEG